jgi:lipoate-protein ligase A
MTERQSWRLLPFRIAPADVLLAEAQAMLAGIEADPRPLLRWYESSRNAAVIGSGQKLEQLNRRQSRVSALSVHRRASGGTLVLFQPGFLMLDIALPIGHRLHLADVSESYRWLGECWQAALARLGIETRLVSIAEARSDTRDLDPLLRRVCFGGRSPYEVMQGERKVVGFSQIRRRSGALLQVGIYVRRALPDLAALATADPAEQQALQARLPARIAALEELLPTVPDPLALIEAFHWSLREQFGATLIDSQWSAAEQAAISAALPRFAQLAQ